MGAIKSYYMNQSKKIILTDPVLASNTNIDFNKIEDLLLISYTLKTLKLVITIMNISYFTGIFFLIICEGVHDIRDIELSEYMDYNMEDRPDLFIDTFGFYMNTRKENLIIMFYFAFTSLSTVGFGDYHPRGDMERLMGAFILLGGVAIFSLIMGNFIEIL
jgi:hypothetical protein